MGTFDLLVESITSSQLLRHINPNPFTMKFALALIALAVLASVDAAPAEGSWSTSKFYTGTLDNAQGAIEDIGKADIRLAAKEEQLAGLVESASSLFNAETILEEATDATDYDGTWKTTTTAD